MLKRLIKLMIVRIYINAYMLVHWYPDERLCKLKTFIHRMGFVPDVRLPIEGGYEVHVWEKVPENEVDEDIDL